MKKNILIYLTIHILLFACQNLKSAEKTLSCLSGAQSSHGEAFEKSIESTQNFLSKMDLSSVIKILQKITSSEVSAEFIYRLGVNYYSGKGVERCITKAGILFESVLKSNKLTIQKLNSARFKLATIYKLYFSECPHKEYIDKVFAVHRALYISIISDPKSCKDDIDLANKDLTYIDFEIAERHFFGFFNGEVAQDYDEAMTLLKIIAEDQKAHHEYRKLAQMYINQEYFDIAQEHYNNQNNDQSYRRISYLLNECFIRKLNSKQVDGDTINNVFIAHYILGEIFFYGGRELVVDFGEAVHWFNLLINVSIGVSDQVNWHGLDYAKMKEIAKLRLAIMYSAGGNGISRKITKALQLFKELRKSTNPYIKKFAISSFNEIYLENKSAVENIEVPEDLGKIISSFVAMTKNKNEVEILAYLKIFTSNTSHENLFKLASALFSGFNGLKINYTGAAYLFEFVLKSKELSPDKINDIKFKLLSIYKYWLKSVSNPHVYDLYVNRGKIHKHKEICQGILNKPRTSEEDSALALYVKSQINALLANIFKFKEKDIEPEEIDIEPEEKWEPLDLNKLGNENEVVIISEAILKELANKQKSEN
ncbi:MAG: hypothetical protein P4L22_06095 [Candidatus Babeliales bacterium]|nr:hypothetical protein [Candidatus Babeliales bacterium]